MNEFPRRPAFRPDPDKEKLRQENLLYGAFAVIVAGAAVALLWLSAVV